MTELDRFIGLEESDALEKAAKEGISCRVVQLKDSLKDGNADSVRVVRVRTENDIVVLTTCEFRTGIPQG